MTTTSGLPWCLDNDIIYFPVLGAPQGGSHQLPAPVGDDVGAEISFDYTDARYAVM